MQLIQAPLHTSEQVRDIIREATTIADAAEVMPGRWTVVFEQACQMLAARASAFIQPQPVQLNGIDLSKR